MNNEKDQKLYDLFKKKLEDPVNEAGFREIDWDALEKKLNKHTKPKGKIFWLPVISSIAALLLLFLGWWLIRPKINGDIMHNKLQAVFKLKTDTVSKYNQQLVTDKQIKPVHSNYVLKPRTYKHNNVDKLSLALSITGNHFDNENNSQKNILNRQTPQILEALSQVVNVVENGLIISPITASTQIPKSAFDAIKNSPAPKNDKTKIRMQTAFRPQYSLSVLAAPDINGVGSFQQSEIGTNFGLLLYASVSKKFTISTGVLYSVKPYVSGFANYPSKVFFTQTPDNISADCKMLDIPLNIGYMVYKKHQNKVSFGTGFSSYIMLHEAYTFNYKNLNYNSTTTSPLNYTVPTSNKYFFGVLNINATYEHQLNSKVGLSIQPYLKLPLTNIGYGQVRLQTTGIAVGLSWNLNSTSKP